MPLPGGGHSYTGYTRPRPRPRPRPRTHTHTHIPGDWRVEGSPYLGKHVAIYLENVLRVSCFRERDGGGG